MCDLRCPLVAFLKTTDVHVWWSRLDSTAGQFDRALGVLSQDELRRAERYCFDNDRRRFVATRAWVRRILGDYVGCDPTSLVIKLSKFGKPFLEHPSAPYFNVSHSQGLAVCAVARQSVGVDIEQIRPMPDAPDIANHFFSPMETSLLRSFPPDELAEAFLRCWTRKEAFIKANGLGLSMALDSFSVSLDDDRADLLECAGGSEEVARWWMVPLHAPNHYVGALAVNRGTAASIHIFEMK